MLAPRRPEASITDHDPLQACADATISGLVHDRWLVGRLPRVLADCGWTITVSASHGYTETADPG